MRILLVCFLFIVGFSSSLAQNAGINRENSIPHDGIYLSYTDFKNNRSVTKQKIVSDIDKDQQEFIGKVLFKDSFSYKADDSVLMAVNSKNVWGYHQNGTFYINFNGDFYRVPVFGSISYFVANVTVMNTGFYDPRFGYTMGPTHSRELREFILDMETGTIKEFNMKNAEDLLSRDETLFEEFNRNSKRKRKEQVYRYIRKYNERHPVYSLK